MRLLPWKSAPPAYWVAFSTRVGGVSEGPFHSLNLGLLTDDEPEHVVENRRRLATQLGIEPERATMTLQVHGARVVEAEPLGVVAPGTPYERADGLWSDQPGQGMLLVTADCLPIAVARAGGEPRLAVLHAGWKGLLEGIAEAGAQALADGELVAAIGPGIGPCCYEVGEEVAALYRERFGADVLQGRNLDLPLAAERALREAGCAEVERSELCTACNPELFFSHRRDRGRTGRQGVVGALR